MATSPQPIGWNTPALAAHRDRGLERYRKFQYAEAAAAWEAGYRLALASGQTHAASRFLLNLGACYHALNQYQRAVEAYVHAYRLSGPSGRVERAALAANLADLYYQHGDRTSAKAAVERSLEELGGAEGIRFRPQLQSLLARAEAQEAPDRAAHLFRQALTGAHQANDTVLAATIVDSLGVLELNRGRLEEAEECFVEGFRLRRLHSHREVALSYINLALLYRARGELGRAGTLADLAVGTIAGAGTVLRAWAIHHKRGQIRLQRGDEPGALADFERAVEYVHRWRADVLHPDSIRVKADVSVESAFRSYILTANRLALKRGNAQLAARSFAVAEMQRAISLRERWNMAGDWRRRLPEQYWEILSQIQAAEAALLRTPDAKPAPRLAALRTRLIEMEAGAGRSIASPGEVPARGLLKEVQSRLGPEEALLAFLLEEPDSWLWAVSNRRFQVLRLPGKEAIAALTGSFREAVINNSATLGALAGRLRGALFQGLHPDFQAKRSWKLVLDDELFDLPFAALDENPGRRAFEILPSATVLLEKPPQEDGRERWFAGAADAVYNRADPRFNAPDTAAFSTHPLAALRLLGEPAGGSIELPRLAASAAEIRACAALWERSVVLEGAAFNREGIRGLAARNPSVLHLAAHFVQRPGRRDQAAVALGLSPAGEMEFLVPSDIPALGVRGLVVLSGCASGRGRALPGPGLIGLARAWLAGGARGVVATLWPVPDGDGRLLEAFYRHLRNSSKGEALRRAQAEMLWEGGGRAQPSYWAGHVLFGRDRD